jgi:hypothetical protein
MAGEQAGAGVEAGRSWSRELYKWLANPLVVTLVGAVVASWVIPHLTRQWQDHQKALEIQSGLVAEMSKSSSDAIMTGRFISSGLYGRASGDSRATQRAFNDGYRTWSVSSAVAASKLEAYFPGTKLGPAWRRYAMAVSDYLQLTTAPGPSRARELASIRAVLPADPRVRWSVLARGSTAPGFAAGYAALGEALLTLRDDVVRRVLDASPSGF